MYSRGPYKRYRVDEESPIPRRTYYRIRQRQLDSGNEVEAQDEDTLPIEFEDISVDNHSNTNYLPVSTGVSQVI